jgi:hypothetical protein
MEFWSFCWLIFLECRHIEKKYLLVIVILFFIQIQFFISLLSSDTLLPSSSVGIVISDNSSKRSRHFTAHDTLLPFFSELPSFTSDNSDYIFSAVIVPRNLKRNPQFTLTMFALSRVAFKFQKGMNRIHENVKNNWEEMEAKHGIPRGSKKSDTIYCLLSHGTNQSSYITESTSLAINNMTEPSANEVIDIIQCPIANQFHDLDDHLVVKLFRISYPTGKNISLLNFTIPWETRRTGYMLSVAPHDPFISPQHHYHHIRNSLSQPYHVPSTHVVHSRFDAWGNLQTSLQRRDLPSFYLSVTLSNDRLTAHLMGSASTPSISSAAYLLEFVYHHISIGIKHIFISVKYSFGSSRMRTVLLLLRHAIEAGHVTVVSQSGDGIDGTSSTHGMTWSELFLKHYHSTVCYYLLKGMYDGSHLAGAYLVMWGLDSFFIPASPHETIQDIFLSLPHLTPSSLRGSQTARLCYALISSDKIIDKYPPSDSRDNPLFPWLLDRFSLGESYFLRNKDIQNLSSSKRYARALESLSSEGPPDGALYDDYGLLLPIHQGLSFASIPTQQYCASLSLLPLDDFLSSSPLLYRIMSRRYRYSLTESLLFSATDNEYSARYAPRVMQLLRQHNLDLVITSDLANENKFIGTKDEHWRRYFNS